MRQTKRLALAALLTALALALNYMERLFPLPLLIPLPGVKLGLANVVTLFALCYLGAPMAFAVLGARVLLGALFAGNASALLYSALGGFFALCVMSLAVRWRRLSLYGVSILGAAAHNLGQICAALLTLGNTAVLGYLPALLLVSVLSGTVTGALSSLLFRAMDATKLRWEI
ncbi:MAG: Gx transporter family protein [Oscillospiraceae bacterium]